LLMKNEAQRLIKKYPNKNLTPVFKILPHKLAIICPMATCDDFTRDLGGTCSEDILVAIGLNCLPITTHDDVVDEAPKDRKYRASLIYAGNISALEEINMLLKNDHQGVAKVIIKTVQENHYRQQFRVDLLWDKKIKNFQEYLNGTRDIYSFASLGPGCALEITGKKDLRKQVISYAINYGLALQLIDDLREIEEDKISGYNSFPILEEKPYEKSFRALDNFLVKARKNLDPTWKHTEKRLKSLENFATKFKKEFNGK
ncbi:MAG: class 1 isoprenoid biosynthesis enzyme, partial [Candidatus Levybacteria bacterium]|nr:class 1 isoprenoid biosynthesis enzyme [Candidatus Levybacteria bacterium]